MTSSPALDDAAELALRGCRRRAPATRERIADLLYQRLHPAMAALGILFLVVVLAQSAARDGSALHGILVAATWMLWAVFACEYLLRLVIAPSALAFVRRTWWQLLFLIIPFLTMIRALLVLRVARPTRVALAALRGTRSARVTLTSRAGWLALSATIVVFAAADILYRSESVRPYGRALHAAALAAVNGEPIGGERAISQILDVVLAIFAAIFFAALAGIVGTFLLERRSEARVTGAVAGSDAQHDDTAPDIAARAP